MKIFKKINLGIAIATMVVGVAGLWNLFIFGLPLTVLLLAIESYIGGK